MSLTEKFEGGWPTISRPFYSGGPVHPVRWGALIARESALTAKSWLDAVRKRASSKKPILPLLLFSWEVRDNI
jgi:hypothetical protein